MKTNGVALTEERAESEEQGEGSLKILDVDFLFLLLLSARVEGTSHEPWSLCRR
jgi:hypothetical protein